MFKKNDHNSEKLMVNPSNFTEKSIEVEGLTVAYEKKEVIRNMSLSIPKGKITILIGANGCGKSTLLKAMARVIPAKAGKIKLFGQDLQKQDSKAIAKRMAVLPQSPNAPAGLLVRELVIFGRFPHQKGMSSFTEQDYRRVDWAINVVGLQELADKPVEQLSGGQRQRAWIAMSLAQDTELLLLDEPTTYLDMAHQLEILLLLQKLNLEENRTILMVLHELNNAARFADHIIGMREGEVVCEGNPKDAINVENLSKLYGIQANIFYDEQKGYPICMNYDLSQGASTPLT